MRLLKSLKTRFFGKRVEGETLRNLLLLMGYDPVKILDTRTANIYPCDAYGRFSMESTESGLDVELYIYRTDVHRLDGSISMDSPANAPYSKIKVVDVEHYRGSISNYIGSSNITFQQ